MSIWVKILLGGFLLAVLAAGVGFWMDLYGIRRGCFASHLDRGRIQSALTLNLQANTAVAAHQYAAANGMLDEALSTLGDSYRLGRDKDDTEEVVTAAKAAAARAEFEIASRMKLDVMSRRAWLVERKQHLADLCRAVARRWGVM